MFENIINFFKRAGKKEEKKETANSKDAAKERLHLVLMQDRANVSADFLELMKQEIIEVIKKYIEVDESAIDVRLTNKENEDGTNGAPALYANIPILNIKNEARKVDKKEVKEQVDKKEEEETVEKEKQAAENTKQENKQKENSKVAENDKEQEKDSETAENAKIQEENSIKSGEEEQKKMEEDKIKTQPTQEKQEGNAKNNNKKEEQRKQENSKKAEKVTAQVKVGQ